MENDAGVRCTLAFFVLNCTIVYAKTQIGRKQMSIEVLLFVIIGLVAVGAAVGMLISPNAVHSALFLILNFASVAFLYLMLDAPFLALVQVAVYAGAIMVLFLFVIMLLGAERTLTEIRQFKWLAPVTLTLALSFLIAVSIAVDQGNIDEQPVPDSAPMVRVVNALPDFQVADVYLNGELYEAGVVFGGLEDDEPTPFEEIEAGEYSVNVALAGDETRLLPLGSFSIERGDTLTLLLHGVIGSDVRPTVSAVPQDLAYFDDDSGNLTVVNAYDGSPVALLDAGSNRIFTGDEASRAPVIVERLETGEVAQVERVRDTGVGYVFVEVVDEAPSDNVIARPVEGTRVQDHASNLWVIAQDRVDENLVPVVLSLPTDTLPQFGSPEAIGGVLFTDYVLQFELVALLLLAAMVGAIVITQRGDVRPKPGRGIRRKVSRPLTSVIATQTGHSVEADGETAIQQPEQPEPAGD